MKLVVIYFITSNQLRRLCNFEYITAECGQRMDRLWEEAVPHVSSTVPASVSVKLRRMQNVVASPQRGRFSSVYYSPVSEQVTSEAEHSIGRLCCLILMPLDRRPLHHERLKMYVGRFFNVWRTFDIQDVSGVRCIDDSVIEPRKCFNTQKNK
jgi:hypothetical protein